MSLQDKFEGALALLREHNEAVGGSDKPGFVDGEKLIITLKASGATTEDRLKALRYEDILEYLPSTNGVKPLLLAKALAAVFRGKDEVSSNSSGNYRSVSAKKAEKMSPRELVEHLDPETPTNAVGKLLETMSKGQAFIVFEHGRIVNVDATTTCLLELKQGYPARQDITVNGSIKPVYKLGDLPDNYADENPLYKDRPLRPDGTCDQTGRSWEGVALEVKQFVRVAVDLNEIEVKIDNAHNILDIVLSPDAMTKLRTRYRKSSLKFDELVSTGSLPKLKIALNPLTKQKSDLFNCGEKVDLFLHNTQVARRSAYKANYYKSINNKWVNPSDFR